MNIAFSRFTEYFLVVAKTENLHKAADQLFISVSAVHRQIAMAEEQFGIQLFERLPNGLKLTLAGELLYAEVLRWQKEFRQTCSRFDEIQGLKRGSVELGLISALSEGFVIDTLADLQQQYPWLNLNIHTYDSKIMIEKIMNNDIDFGFILDPIVHAKLDVLAFMEIPIGFVMSPEHVLAKHHKLSLAETHETRHIMPDQPLIIHERVMAIYKKQQINPVYQTLSNDIRLMISMLKQNMGIAILSYLDVYSAVENQELIFIPIHEKGIQPLTLALCAGSRRQLSRISQLFIQELMQRMEAIKLNKTLK
ncbi:LysR family transcriptional regulator [Acinetobacter ihumii]|uniref:LysR family transcriptional regulator n=1 Tax=Acinetobacter ihumii TaxID=2483802 RepID=UPI0010311612|nr:LysR family transcriptional regulator [Acinetobacter ihumii]